MDSRSAVQQQLYCLTERDILAKCIQQCMGVNALRDRHGIGSMILQTSLCSVFD